MKTASAASHCKEIEMITLYTKPACPYCDRAKIWLENNDLPYRVINVLEDTTALDFIKSRGHKTVPQIYFNDEVLVEGGYDGLKKSDPDTLKEKLAA
jgi:glutaredoxin